MANCLEFLYRDVQFVKWNCPQDIHLISLNIKAEVVHLGHIHGPEDAKERKTHHVCIDIIPFCLGGTV